MADPISVFPEFVRAQVFPPTATTAIGVDLDVVLEGAEIVVQIVDEEVIPVLLPEGLTICFEE